MSAILRSLRDLIRKSKSQLALHDLNDIVRGVADLILADARMLGVEIQVVLDPDLRPVLVDSVQIRQVIMNLARNALDAIAASESPQRVIELRTSKHSAEFVQLSIRDSGIGIAPEQVKAVFEPFYTTKSSGLGMGLAISRTIIETVGGQLWVEPNIECGVTFHFTIPFADPDLLPSG